MDISELQRVQTAATAMGTARRRIKRYLRFSRACELEIKQSLKRRSDLADMARRAPNMAWKLIPAAAQEGR